MPTPPDQVEGAIQRRLRKFAPSALLLLATLAIIFADAARWGFVSIAILCGAFYYLLFVMPAPLPRKRFWRKG